MTIMTMIILTNILAIITMRQTTMLTIPITTLPKIIMIPTMTIMLLSKNIPTMILETLITTKQMISQEA
jgi:hypothetical protein